MIIIIFSAVFSGGILIIVAVNDTHVFDIFPDVGYYFIEIAKVLMIKQK